MDAARIFEIIKKYRDEELSYADTLLLLITEGATPNEATEIMKNFAGEGDDKNSDVNS